MASFYDILGVDSSVGFTSEDLKRAYKRALLQHHPDKAGSTRNVAGGDQGKTTVSVDDIALAYKTLSDTRSRQKYDLGLQNRVQISRPAEVDGTTHRTGLDTVDLDALVFDDGSESWSRSCRCGDGKGFIVTEPELAAHADEGEIIIGCRGCSLWLRILFGVEDR